MNIHEVPLDFVNQVWPHAERFIESALSFSGGDYSAEEAKVMVINGVWSMIIATDENNTCRGAAIVQYFNRPNDRVAFIIALGGKWVTNSDNAAQLFNIFRTNGATAVEAAARDDILKFWQKYGLGKKYTIISATL